MDEIVEILRSPGIGRGTLVDSSDQKSPDGFLLPAGKLALSAGGVGFGMLESIH